MNRNSLLYFAFLTILSFQVSAQTVTITGYAPSYVGKTLEVLEIQDYLSHREQLLASTVVREDSIFEITFASEKVQKITIKSKNNKAHMYVDPGFHYKVGMPDKDKFTPYRPDGNQVELTFYNLDSLEINYKILSFQRWIDDFIGNNYHLRTYNETDYVDKLDAFKTNVEEHYTADSNDFNSLFFRTFVRYSVAGLDNVNNAAQRNRYEKYDFYIKRNSIHYDNDAYMAYIAGFYQEMFPRLHAETNNEVYQAILQSSPTLMMKALRTEYTLENLRLREMVMIQSLSEVFHDGSYPQTNILTILDSISTNGPFEENRIIANNLKFRLTELVPGAKAPDFVMASQGKSTKTLNSFAGKYLYVAFMNADSEENMRELPLLQDIHTRYGEEIQFVTMYISSDSTSNETLELLDQLEWETYNIKSTNPIWKKYKIESFPSYTLIDVTGNIVASPALGPKPNGQYETIDKTFYQIKKQLAMERK